MKNLEITTFNAKRISRSYEQFIHAVPSLVFPLLCPVREAEWLDSWEYSLIYSESGYAEAGCVFSTPAKHGDDTIWIITKRDENRREIEFSRFTPNSRVSTCNYSPQFKK